MFDIADNALPILLFGGGQIFSRVGDLGLLMTIAISETDIV